MSYKDFKLYFTIVSICRVIPENVNSSFDIDNNPSTYFEITNVSVEKEGIYYFTLYQPDPRFEL